MITLVSLWATPQLQVEFVGGRGGAEDEVVEGDAGVVEGGGGEGVEGAETSSEAETTHLNTSFHYVDLDIKANLTNLNPRLFFLLFDRKSNTMEPP